MIAELLSEGRENARTGRTLCAILNITLRELVASVERERRQGQPICASTDGRRPGYFLAANKGEMQRYCNTLMKRAGEIHKTRRACLESMDRLPAGDTDE